MRILVVEDEPKTGDYLRQGLTEAGFIVDLARDGPGGLHLGSTGDYDLAILDVMLPGLDGWRLLEGLRRAGAAMPVLFLTARDRVDDRVRGLELGADDYLVKPFEMEELFFRLRALSARGRRPEVSTQVLGEVVLDHAAGIVVRNGRRIRLHELQLKVLRILAARAPLTVERAVLERELWGDDVPDSDSLRTHIYRLRNALTLSGERELIETVHGKGWRFVG